jgi:carboxypeptidase family protein
MLHRYSSLGKMRFLIVAALAFGATLAGCARSHQSDIMSAPARCDTVPPPVRPHEQIGGTVPVARQPGPDSVLVTGTVVEATTGRALQGASVSLFDSSTALDQRRPVVLAWTSAAAGFALVAPQAGSYTLVTGHIGYRRRTQAIQLRAGRVDTVRVELQYQHCVGP